MRDRHRVRSLARRVLPARLRRLLREIRRELPHRAHDFPADVRERLLRRPDRLPPAWLRRRVGLTSSRAEFIEVGERAVADIVRAYREAKPGQGDPGKWLDFGCGAGRMLVPLREAGIRDVWGVDVDGGAIRWLQRRHGEERFRQSSPLPPLPFPNGSFDVVLAVSVFSHLDETGQLAWLEEVSRILCPGGLLVVSTHGGDLLVTRGDLSPEQIETFRASGFLFAAGSGPFNEGSAFHAPEYLARAWGPWFECRVSLPRGLTGYQDLTVWQSRLARNSL